MATDILMQSAKEDWLTPEEIWKPAQELMGGIDLDPCAEESTGEQNIPAIMHFTRIDNGLQRAWLFPSCLPTRVFMNPPYNKNQDHAKFVEKLLLEYAQGHVRYAVVLLAARTETSWYRSLGHFPRCHVDHRLKFLLPSGEPGGTATFPSVVFGLGMTNAEFYNAYHNLGEVVVRYYPVDYKGKRS